jgi:hypothetical protein
MKPESVQEQLRSLFAPFYLLVVFHRASTDRRLPFSFAFRGIHSMSHVDVRLTRSLHMQKHLAAKLTETETARSRGEKESVHADVLR